MQKTITLGTDAMLESARSLVRQGVLTEAQFREMERRNSLLKDTARKTTIELR